MARPYSQDLCLRVVRFVESGHPAREVAAVFAGPASFAGGNVTILPDRPFKGATFRVKTDGRVLLLKKSRASLSQPKSHRLRMLISSGRCMTDQGFAICRMGVTLL